MRNAFIHELVALAEKNKNIVLIVGDLGFSVIEPFVERFPDRFINAGVAEQNMMGLAAGMASEGCHVFVYSIANFPTFRCAEQIRNDVDYHKLPVTVVAVGGGMGYGNLGYSHHAIQDYALIRSMPNMLIAAPGDPFEVRACMKYLINNPQPSYLRLGKAGEPNMNLEIPTIFPGKWNKIGKKTSMEVKRKAILSTGATLEIAVNLSKQSEFSEYEVFSMPLWGQSYKVLQKELAVNFDEIITIEDHLLDGGFGSWMMESLSFHSLANLIKPRALSSDVCGMVGTQKSLNEFGGLLNIIS